MEVLGVLGYSGEQLGFLTSENFSFASGNGLCVIDVNKGPKDVIWKSVKGIQKWAFNAASNKLVIAPKIDGDSIALMTLPEYKNSVPLPNPTGGKIIDFSFSMDGMYLLGLSDNTDPRVFMWNTQTNRVLFCVELPVQCEKCVMHPIDNMMFTAFGASGLVLGSLQEVLEEYDVKFEVMPIPSSEVSIASTHSCTSDRQPTISGHVGVTCACWTPPNGLLIGTAEGSVFFVDALNKFVHPIINVGTSLPSPSIVSVVVSSVNIIVGASSGHVYWYTFSPSDLTTEYLSDISPELLQPLQVMTMVNQIGHEHESTGFLSTLVVDPEFTNCVAGTTQGMIYKFAVDVQERMKVEDADDDIAVSAQPSSEGEALEVSTVPTYVLHPGVAVCAHAISIPISDFAATASPSGDNAIINNFDHTESVQIVITGSYSGAVTFWRSLNCAESSALPSGKMSSLSGTGGIVKSIPKVPLRLCRYCAGEGLDESELNDSSFPNAITCFETLSVASYGGGKLIAVGTVSGWLEVWRVEAFMRDSENDELADELNEEDALNNVRAGVKLIYRRRFYRTALTAISSSDTQACFAIASQFDSTVYVINTSPKSKLTEVKSFTLGDLSNHAVGLSWSGPLLWVSSHSGIFFTFLPDMNFTSEGSDEESSSTSTSPSFADINPINPKAMWEGSIKAIGCAVPMAGSVGGGIFARYDVPIISVLDSFPSVFDLEQHNLLHNEENTAEDEQPEVPMLPMPGGIKHSPRIDSPILCSARANGNQLYATGCADGSIYVWKARRGEINLVNRYQPHSVPVIAIVFSIDSSQLVSCASDGSIYVTIVEKSLMSSSPIVGLLLENDLDEMNSTGSVVSENSLFLDQQRYKVSQQLKESFKSKHIHFQSIVENIANRLQTLLTRNADANELEKMDLSEFVIDVKRKDEILQNNIDRVNKIQEMYARKNAANELIAARIRQQCWDSMEKHSVSLFPIQDCHSMKVTVASFPVEKVTDRMRIILDRVKRLRAIEIISQKASFNTKGGGHIDRVKSGNFRCSWGRNNHGCPSMISWLLNDGTRWPIDDVVKVIIEQDRINAAAKDAGDSASPTKEGKEGDSKKKMEKQESTHAPSAVEDDDDISLTADMSIADQDIDTKNIFNLLYSPQTVRTQVQKRMQIIFLKEILRIVKTNFNKHFDKLYQEKEDVVSGINAKNARIKEIASELDVMDEGSGVEPKWDDTEIHDSAITVSDEEVKSRPYETEKMRRLRLEEEERKRREAANDDDDGKQRALNDMMNGTLEVKRDVFAEASALQRPAWMDEIPPEVMTDAQKKEVEEFDEKYAALQDEKAKYRKSLEIEMKRLKVEVQESSKAFDEKLVQMSRIKMLTQREILAQELYISRLALSMVKREQAWSMLKDTEESIEKCRVKREKINSKIDRLSIAVEEAKQRLQTAQDEEKALDRSFKRDLQTLCNTTFDQDTLKLFSQLYRMRKYNTVGVSVHDEASEVSDHVEGRASGRTSTKRRTSLKRSMGSSKDKSSMRKSKGNSVSNRGEALGPLQMAAKEMIEQDAQTKSQASFKLKDPFYQILVAQEREQKMADSQIPLLSPLHIELDCPEGFNVDPYVWSKLQELRLTRISKEIEAKNELKKYSELKKKLDSLSNEEDAVHAEAVSLRSKRESIIERIVNLMEDLEVVIAAKQGQEEVDSDAVVTDYSDAKLIPTSIIKKYNTRINELGKEKIGVLVKIKQFRRKMNLVDWEAQHLQLEAWHLEEYYTDSQLFRVTRDLQRVIKDGSDADQAKGRQEKISVRKDFKKKDAETKLAKISKAIELMKAQIEERESENRKFQEKISTLRGEVAVREQVVRHGSRGSGSVGGGEGLAATSTLRATARMKKVVARRKLVDTARVQAEEIDYLKQELDKMRQKTFPSFVRATRTRLVYNPDERV
mmetsp:Transcript_407/g.764  ORF Transcript_407/g.764 Transcript_407/m.764 type:complete len:1920 (-) Transcript_407:94-5853(-)